jgi:hypothetical protein
MSAPYNPTESRAHGNFTTSSATNIASPTSHGDGKVDYLAGRYT